ncbi:MAG: arylsulfatase [Planctomycetaceae bacterium]|nr:arylsulfatase [Planctomycetaceae bacterium]
MTIRLRSTNLPTIAWLTAFLATAVSVQPVFAAEPADSSRPDIIVILSDDMGFSDLSCYGGEIETPNLNALAAGGLRFTQFYNTARCCPTRAALLSGLYSHQAGIGWMMEDSGADGYRGELNRRCRTMAEVLRPAGYGTYMTGKWHVTRQVRPDGNQSNWPCQRGFDRFYGTIHGAGSFYDPNSLTRDNTQISPFADSHYQPEQYYYTDAISDHAIRYIQEHHQATPDRPLFMYMAYTAAHWPMHALPEDIAKYRGRYDGGYPAIRAARFERVRERGLVSASTELSPVAEDWGQIANREWEIRCMEVYAAMVDRMDQGIGRLVQTLRDTGRLENTLILFMQDNGGCAEGLGRTPKGEPQVRAATATLTPMKPEDLQFDMIPKQSRDGFPVLQGSGVLPGPADTYIAYGRGWANVSNTPFREYKHWVHEGGISTPLIAHWPKGIDRPGRLERQPGHLIDIMATCVDLGQADYPADVDGHTITPLEGRSLKAAFDGGEIERDAIYWEHEGNRAVRQGKWKLVAKDANGPWELYDIDRDRSEMHNLAAAEPERVQQLSRKWQQWAERSQVLPLTPYYNKQARAEFSRKKRFVLHAGDDLPRDQAPNVANRPFTLNVAIADAGQQGVLVAQGGSSSGYALYQQDGNLVFSIRIKGQLESVSGPLPVKKGTIHLEFESDGHVVATMNNQPVLNGNLSGLVATMPLDGLQVGCDQAGLVGSYQDSFPFDGTIESAEIRLQ